MNGGQTTASIYHTWKKDKVDISNVFVPVKLTIVKNRENLSFLDFLFFPNANAIDKEKEEVLSLVIEFPNDLITNSYQLTTWTEIKKIEL